MVVKTTRTVCKNNFFGGPKTDYRCGARRCETTTFSCFVVTDCCSTNGSYYIGLLFTAFPTTPSLRLCLTLTTILMEPIWAAFWAVENGLGIREAARLHGVNLSTLWRLRKNPVPKSHRAPTIFTAYDEFMLASIIR